MLRNSGTFVTATVHAALCCAMLAACSGKTPATPTTGSLPATAARLRVLGTRVGQPTAFGITTAFVATTGDGIGIGGLTTADFQIKEDGAPIVAKESAAIILARTAEPYLTVVLDNTPTVRTSGAVDALLDGALALIDSLGQAAPSARAAVVTLAGGDATRRDLVGEFWSALWF